MKRLFFATLASMFFLSPLAAQAQTLTLPENVRNAIVEILDEKQVPKEKQELLLEKLAKGELWDSMKSEYKDLAPQTVTPTMRRTDYPDGSYKIESETLNPLSLSDIITNGLLSEESMPFLLSQRLQQMGIPQEAASSLIDSWKEGKTWESLKPNTRPVDTRIEDGRRVSIYVDGTRRISPVQTGPADEHVLYAARDFGLVVLSMRIHVERNEKTIRFTGIDHIETTALLGQLDETHHGHLDGARPVTHAWLSTVYHPTKGAPVRLWIKLFANPKESWLQDRVEALKE